MAAKRTLIALFAVSLLAVTAWGQQLPPQYTKMSQDGTPIPDVDKNPAAPQPDNSCWLASAANILGAAGYGSGGTAQQRATSIYNQLVNDYGTAAGGVPDQAISYWLAAYGKNPGSPEYNPSLNYTDVTAEYRTLTQVDYSFLKNELYRCQYVGVGFDNPAHAMTLVGWDDNIGQSIWHDSDRTVGPGGDDSYINSFTSTWDLVDPQTQQTYLYRADSYWTLCPGLDKDDDFVANYDVAWAPSPNGPTAREAGDKVGIYASPMWMTEQWVDPNDPNVSFERFFVGNEQIPEMQKQIQLLVDFYGRDANYANEDIRLRYINEQGVEVIASPDSTQLSADNGQVLFTWELDCQPQWEEILFPSYMDYYVLEGEVASWNVATICVPEPATMVLLAMGGLAVVMRRRRSA
ncbi:MAG: PEP-CTERM sorting domain-containing protein [Phycisphaerae bacterium]